jgi:hypothetical protein
VSVCLHCGKQLALLKTFAVSTQFCSDDHRQRYQDHSNRLALDRLLRATDREKGSKQPVTRPEPVDPERSAPPPPEISFLMENPGQPIAVRRRQAGNTAPMWRERVTLYPSVPPLESNSIFRTSPPAILQQEFQDAGIALGIAPGGGGGSQSGSASVLVLPHQILKAERSLPRTQTMTNDTAVLKSAMSNQAGSNVIGNGREVSKP